MLPRIQHVFTMPGSAKKIVDPRHVSENFTELMRSMNALGIENFAKSESGGVITNSMLERRRGLFSVNRVLSTRGFPMFTWPISIELFTAVDDCYLVSATAYDVSVDATALGIPEVQFSGQLYTESVLVAEMKGATGKETVVPVSSFVEPRVRGGETVKLTLVDGHLLGITLEFASEFTT